MNLEKCKICDCAIFDTQIIGWTNKHGREVELREKENYPSSCCYRLNGARLIDNYCPKEIETNDERK